MKKRILSLTLTLLLLLTVLPLAAGAQTYVDVPESNANYDAIEYVTENGLMNGMGGGRFAPKEYFTRAMFVTILGRMEGVNTALYTGTPFVDVSAKDRSLSWAAPYIQWASENGIVNGVGNGRFDPNGVITREQFCTIVFRYLKDGVFLVSEDAPASVWLSDGDRVSDYAVTPVRTMVGLGLMGLADDANRVFKPQASMNRGDIAEYFTRVHLFVTTGCVPGFWNCQDCESQTWGDIAEAIRDSVQHEWDWYVDCAFTDSSRTVFGGTVGLPLEKVVAPGVHSRFDLNALSYDYFAPKAVTQLQQMKDFSERNGGLYISATDGLGGFMVDSCAIDATKINDTVYEVTLIEYSGSETVNTVTVTYYLAENNRWVFSAPLPIDLQYAELAFG